MKPTTSKPFKIVRYGEGSTQVTVRAERNTISGVLYSRYAVCYADDGKRHRQRFSKSLVAKQAAQAIHARLENGHRGIKGASAADWFAFTDARDKLAAHGVEIGWLVDEFDSLTNTLPKGVTLRHAVEDFSKRHSNTGKPLTIAEAVEEFVALKNTAGLSVEHLLDVTRRLEKFSADFSGDQMKLSSLSGIGIQQWMDALPFGARSKRNYLVAVVALVRWAVNRKFIGRDIIDEIAAIQRPKEHAKEVEIFAADELREILDNAKLYDESEEREGRPDILPMLAIGAFAGLRTAEIYRLNWSEIDFDERQITVSGRTAKTGQRRVAPMSDNLVEWLMPYRQKRGPVAPFATSDGHHQRFMRFIDQQRLAAGIKKKFKWKCNGLRHSFCSYRLPLVNSVAQVSYEAGNSPKMIHRHYKQLTTVTAANAWFSIRPTTSKTNILKLKKA